MCIRDSRIQQLKGKSLRFPKSTGFYDIHINKKEGVVFCRGDQKFFEDAKLFIKSLGDKKYTAEQFVLDKSDSESDKIDGLLRGMGFKINWDR